jgi:hypothetical protein
MKGLEVIEGRAFPNRWGRAPQLSRREHRVPPGGHATHQCDHITYAFRLRFAHIITLLTSDARELQYTLAWYAP